MMFEMEPGELGEDEITDAIGELTNMIGGNLKACMPQPTSIGLPSIVEGKNYSLRMPGSREVTRVGFEFQGASVIVALLEVEESNKTSACQNTEAS